MADEEPNIDGDEIAKDPNEVDEDEKKEDLDQQTLKLKQQLQKFQRDIKQNLSSLGKTPDNGSYAYTKLNLAQQQIERIFPYISNYKFIRYLDLSGNQLTDVRNLTSLKYLLSLNCSKNQINSLNQFNSESDEEVYPYLQVLNVSGNKITLLESLQIRNLRRLSVNQNEIDNAELFDGGHPTLQFLDISQNQLQNLQGINECPELVELNAEENQITDFRDLKDLPKLRSLVLRANKMKQIQTPFPYLPSLYHLNVAENVIADKFHTEMKKIVQLQSIFSISINGNPCGDDVGGDGALKQEILMVYPFFLRINEEDVTLDDRNQAAAELQARKEEEQRKRQEEEDLRKQQEQERRLQEEEQQRIQDEAKAAAAAEQEANKQAAEEARVAEEAQAAQEAAIAAAAAQQEEANKQLNDNKQKEEKDKQEQNAKKLNEQELKQMESIAEAAFQIVDQDGSGYVDKSELKKLLDEVATDMAIALPTEQHVEEVLKELDKNNDGQLSLQEFLVIIQHILNGAI